MILGAGASAPYGYPTGVDFKSEILANCSNSEPRTQIKEALGCTDQFIDRFREAFVCRDNLP